LSPGTTSLPVCLHFAAGRISPPRPTWRARRSNLGTQAEAVEVVMASAQPKPDFNGKQGRQDSNLQPPVLETGALPVELRP
jgi:hypothetical protein